MTQRTLACYGPVAQVFHWITAILVLVAFIYGPGGSEQRVYSPARDFDRQFHETLGMCLFALVVMRVLWRMFDTQPDSPQVPRWVGIAAKAVQLALYHHIVLKDGVLASMLPRWFPVGNKTASPLPKLNLRIPK